MTARLGLGLIGSGFMGRCHMFAFTMAPRLFDLEVELRPAVLADSTPEKAAAMAARFGFARPARDWRELVEDPEVDIVAITAPHQFHVEMARAALEAGKHVFCEKPLAPDYRQARELAELAARAGVVTGVGFNYQKHPLVQTARRLIAQGELGEPWSVRGIHAEDFMADPERPWDWRLDPAGTPGAIGDLGSHITSMVRYLVGDIRELAADASTLIRSRPDGERGGLREVTVPDECRMLVRFEGGAVGSLEANWLHTGRKLYLSVEIAGSEGALALNFERMNEMRLYLKRSRAPGREGFIEIPAGPDHPDYAAFVPAPGHHLGFNEVKTIEVKYLLEAILRGRPFHPDFADAARTQQVLDAACLAARERRWVQVAEVA